MIPGCSRPIRRKLWLSFPRALKADSEEEPEEEEQRLDELECRFLCFLVFFFCDFPAFFRLRFSRRK